LVYDALKPKFGRGNVFLDTEAIQEGDVFPEKIQNAIRAADQFLVVIGDQWLTVTGRDGRRRLDDPKDWVRREVELARAENLRIVPVLVHGASMPSEDELPDDIRWLSFRQAETAHDAQWDTDMDGIVDRLLKRRPRNRFARFRELRSLAPLPQLMTNALVKPCAIVFSLAIASLALFVHPSVVGSWIFVVIGAVAYSLLAVTSYFTLAEAEWVGSRDAQRRASHPPEPTIA
jgi:hypothetical protein